MKHKYNIQELDMQVSTTDKQLVTKTYRKQSLGWVFLT